VVLRSYAGLMLDSAVMGRGRFYGTEGYPADFRQRVVDLVEAGRPVALIAAGHAG